MGCDPATYLRRVTSKLNAPPSLCPKPVKTMVPSRTPSEKIVRSSHSTQGHPETILEIERILREHAERR